MCEHVSDTTKSGQGKPQQTKEEKIALLPFFLSLHEEQWRVLRVGGER
jgi:hypothetical protein